jgi:hypothetical protein
VRRHLPAPMVVLDHGRNPTPFQLRCLLPGCGWQGRWHARLHPARAGYAAHLRGAHRRPARRRGGEAA